MSRRLGATMQSSLCCSRGPLVPDCLAGSFLAQALGGIRSPDRLAQVPSCSIDVPAVAPLRSVPVCVPAVLWLWPHGPIAAQVCVPVVPRPSVGVAACVLVVSRPVGVPAVAPAMEGGERFFRAHDGVPVSTLFCPCDWVCIGHSVIHRPRHPVAPHPPNNVLIARRMVV